MVKPIRLRNAEIIAQARATLIRAGRGPELEQARKRAVVERARAIVERRQEQDRLRRIAVLAAQKAVLAVKQAYAAQDKVADEFERERWLGLRDFVVSELMRIVEGKRP
jgi:hypothetical protein